MQFHKKLQKTEKNVKIVQIYEPNLATHKKSKNTKMNPRVYKLTKTMHFYKNTALWHHATPVNTLCLFFWKTETRVKIVKKCVKKSKKSLFCFFPSFLQSFDEITVSRPREKYVFPEGYAAFTRESLARGYGYGYGWWHFDWLSCT